MKRIATVAGVSALLSLLPAPHAHADNFITCPSGRSAVATAVTSCAFADNVRDAYFGQGGPQVIAYSPVTGQTYLMNCVPGFVARFWDGSPPRVSVSCYGGNNAEVVVW